MGMVSDQRHKAQSLIKCTKYRKLYKMQTIALSEFRAHASAMIDLVEKGETVRILRHGKPVAELVQVAPAVTGQMPAWKKRKVQPVKVDWPEGMSAAKMLLDERDAGR